MKEIKNKAYIECPKCGRQATVGTASSGFVGMGIVTLLAGGCLIWIPVLGWVCAPVAFLLGFIFIILGIIAAIIGGATIECKHCNSKYKLTKEEYRNHMYKNTSSFSTNAAEFTSGVKESWKNSKEANKHIFINKIEKLENKIENTTNEKKIAKMKKEIKRLEKHI
ncbi:hypothetical protein SAMN02910355_0285 [Terrisporobacter glycolicus]|nr:hypothetical protein SAMN02910355_0285 [Terrisporobacter glycolicus]